VTGTLGTMGTTGATAQRPPDGADVSGDTASVVQWARVGAATFEVRHHYRYAYPFPVADLRHRLVMVPPNRRPDTDRLSLGPSSGGSGGCPGKGGDEGSGSSVGQELLDFRLAVSGPAEYRVSWRRDGFGNRVALVRAPHVAELVEFAVTYRVRRTAAPTRPAAAGTPPADSWHPFLRHTPLTAPDARLRAAAASLSAVDPSAPTAVLASRAERWTAQALRYAHGATDVRTTAAQALHRGRGVCQDHAHVLLCLLRLLRVPARYVSGHLVGEGAPHAWVEALVTAPDDSVARVVTLDPTHHWITLGVAPTGLGGAGSATPSGAHGPHPLQYIAVAIGRDYADVAPTSGTCTGPAPGAMTWGKTASILDVCSGTAEALSNLAGQLAPRSPLRYGEGQAEGQGEVSSVPSTTLIPPAAMSPPLSAGAPAPP
jgi:transglutaminase-like putative cysteine protease